MKTAIHTKIWASGGMVDTHVLGTCPVMGEGSSPFSPTSGNNWKNIVAQGVALAITCCTKKLKRRFLREKS